MMNLAKAAATVGGFTVLSRILGFIRDAMIASVLGATGVSDAFFVALRIPNLFRRLFAEGAFNAAFVPLYSEWQNRHSKEESQKIANNVFSCLALALIILIVVFELFMPSAVELIAPGFAENKAQMLMSIELSRITFPYILFISIAAFFSAILNSMHKFAAAAVAPALLNICVILSIVFSYLYDYEKSYILSLGVFISGVLQMIFLYYVCKNNGIKVEFTRPRLTPEMKTLLILGLPGALSAGAIQINLFVANRFASELPSGAVSYLFYADRLYQLPLAVIGIAISTALLPQLSHQLKKGIFDVAHKTQEKAIELSMLLTLPATVGLLYLAYPIIHVLFVRGEFSVEAGNNTAMTLIAYSVGLPAYVLIKIFNVTFFARQDTKTPFYVALLSVVVNIALNYALVNSFQYVGLALATSISTWISCLISVAILFKRKWFSMGVLSTFRVTLIALASAIMYYGGNFIYTYVADGRITNMSAISLMVNIFICLIVYSIVIIAFRIVTVQDLISGIKQK